MVNSMDINLNSGNNSMDSLSFYKCCVDCGKTLNKSSKFCKTLRCVSCNIIYFHKSNIINIVKINENRAKDIKENRKKYCIICNKELSKSSYYRNHNKCGSCVKKSRIISKTTRERMSSSKTGRILSIQTKLKMSQTRIKNGLSKGKNNPGFGKIPHGKGSYYKNIWMRSSWEISYAKYLDNKRIKYLYEPKTFNLGSITYTPDFYLPETDTYIEIKGYWRMDAKKKFKIFKKLYPNKTINILEEKQLKELGVL